MTDKMIMFLLRPTCDNKNTVKKKKPTNLNMESKHKLVSHLIIWRFLNLWGGGGGVGGGSPKAIFLLYKEIVL